MGTHSKCPVCCFVEIVSDAEEKDSDDDPFLDLDEAEVDDFGSFRKPEDQEQQ